MRNGLEPMDEFDIPTGVEASTGGGDPGTGGDTRDASSVPGCPTRAGYDRTKGEAHFEAANLQVEDGRDLVIDEGIAQPTAP